MRHPGLNYKLGRASSIPHFHPGDTNSRRVDSQRHQHHNRVEEVKQHRNTAIRCSTCNSFVPSATNVPSTQKILK